MDFGTGSISVANSNATLKASKNLKDDELYATYECIENEL